MELSHVFVDEMPDRGLVAAADESKCALIVVGSHGRTGISLRDALASYERQLIVRALKAAGGVQKKAAELLSVKPTTLHEMMKRLNVSIDSIGLS